MDNQNDKVNDLHIKDVQMVKIQSQQEVTFFFHGKLASLCSIDGKFFWFQMLIFCITKKICSTDRIIC